jgi:hypothetical protein
MNWWMPRPAASALASKGREEPENDAKAIAKDQLRYCSYAA